MYQALRSKAARASAIVLCVMVSAESAARAQTPAAPAQTDSAQIREELDGLRREFESIRDAYGARLTALEARLAQVEGRLRHRLNRLRRCRRRRPQFRRLLRQQPAAAPAGRTREKWRFLAGAAGAGGPQGSLPVYGSSTALSKIFNPDIAVIGNFLGAAGRNEINPAPAFEMNEAEALVPGDCRSIRSRRLLPRLFARRRRDRRGLHYVHDTPGRSAGQGRRS